MSAQPLDDLGGHAGLDTQRRDAAEVTNSLPGQSAPGVHRPRAGQGPDTAAANGGSTATEHPPLRAVPPTDQETTDAHGLRVGGATSPDRTKVPAEPMAHSPGRDQAPAAAARPMAAPTVGSPRLLDPFLALSADVLDDLETVRTANENRLRQLTRATTDKDGEDRGFGLDESHPDVARLRAIVDLIGRAEHDATLQLQRQMRRHPLGPWVKATVGLGEKQAARLIAAVGDPYFNTLHDRPRTVSELWAYCGYHTLPIGHSSTAIQVTLADGGKTGSSDPSQLALETQVSRARVAARRQRGQKANWSNDAKMRAHLCAESCIKQARSPYRPLYDARRAATGERTHVAPCVRCGPSGKPAQPGTPWSAGHQHADALRIVAKRILRDLWRAARDAYQP